jgi:hypothetical protein
MFRRVRQASLSMIAVVLAWPSAVGAQQRLTPARVKGLADDAGVVRGLLRLEDRLTFDAVAMRPKRRALGRRIRAENKVLIALCTRIIRDEARISRLEKEIRRARAASGGAEPAKLTQLVADSTADIKARIAEIQAKGDNISIADMFEMQLLMNRLSQLSQTSSAVVNAADLAIDSMARHVPA